MPKYTRQDLDDMLVQLDYGLSIFAYYLAGQSAKTVRVGGVYRSPFPFHEDKNPSFSLFRHSSGFVWFRDHAVESGDAWKCVERMEGLDFADAIKFVRSRFLGLPEEPTFAEKYIKRNLPPLPPLVLPKKQERSEFTLTISRRPESWQSSDQKYYQPHIISVDTLRAFHAQPLSSYTYERPSDGVCFTVAATASEPMYHYWFPGSGRDKVVRPYSDKRRKWISTTRVTEDIFGLHLVPAHCTYLIIVAGNRDCMALYQLLQGRGIYVVAFSAEGHVPTPDQIEFLHNIADNIFVLYDRDRTGLEFECLLTDQADSAAWQDWFKKHKEREGTRFGFRAGLGRLLDFYKANDVYQLLERRSPKLLPKLADWIESAVKIL